MPLLAQLLASSDVSFSETGCHFSGSITGSLGGRAYFATRSALSENFGGSFESLADGHGLVTQGSQGVVEDGTFREFFGVRRHAILSLAESG